MSDDREARRRKIAEIRGKQERRIFDGNIELRDEEGGRLGLVGWACRTNVEYTVGGFTEVVRPGSFTRSLGNSPDVILVLNHGDAGSGLPIARTRSGTMRLTEDARGLRVDADLDPEDPDVHLLQRKMARGDLDGQMSFAFRVPSGGDKWSDDFKRREITTCEINGGDCSIVTFAASPTTSSELVARAMIEAAGWPLPDHTTRARERLAVLRGASRRPVGADDPGEPELDRYRRRLAELRAGR